MRLLTAGTDLQLLNQDTCCSLQTVIRIFLVSTLVFKNFVAFGPSQMYASSSVKLVFSCASIDEIPIKNIPRA
jgi:hypothetical protein